MDAATHPEVSVSRLSRYCVATTPAARKRLLEGAKRPEEIAFRWYDGARVALVDFLLQGLNPAVLTTHRERLLGGAQLDEQEARRVALCLEALAHFEASVPSLGLEGLVFQRAPEPHPLEIAGVAIRATPEVIITDPRRPGQVGSMSFYLSKHEPLPELGAEYATTLMLLHAQRHLGSMGEVAPRLVRMVDVFAARSYEAPKSIIRRGKDVELFCEEVAARWSSVH